MPSYRQLVPLRFAFGEILPSEWLAPVEGFLDKVAVDAGYSRTRWDHLGFSAAHRLYILEKARLDLPLVPGMAIELGEAGGYPTFVVRAITTPIFEIAIEEFPITLWLPPAILGSYTHSSADGWTPALDAEREPIVGFPITVTTGIVANEHGDVNLSDGTRVSVPFGAMIGDTGLVLDFRTDGTEPPLEILLGDVPARLRDDEDLPDDVKAALDGFKGVFIRRLAAHYVRPGSTVPPLSLANAAVGSGGFFGTIAIGLPENADAEIEEDDLERYRATPDAATRAGLVVAELEGMVVVLQYFGITFSQSIPSGSRIAGYVFLPFGDRWVRLEAEIGGPDGDLMISLGGTDERPLFDLTTDWLEVKADELRYFLKDDIHWVGIKGSAKPKLGDIAWPKFKLDELRVSSNGDVEVDGGWIELPQQQVIDLAGFRVEIRALGFGKELDTIAGAPAGSSRSWIGFSGGIRLVEGIPLSASVEGLKVSWNPDMPEGAVDVTLKGVALSLEIPGTLKLAGKVEYKRLTGTEADGGLTGDLFLGAVELDLICLRTEVEAQLIIGKLTDAEGHTFDVAYVVLAAEFPAPIPIGATGAGLYGLKGLVGVNIAPDRHLSEGEPEPWFEWYKAERGDAPKYNITHVDKWVPRRDAYAFGAGLTVGTVYDDGFTINVGALVAVLLPGPVVLIEGKGNLLKQRGERDQEGAFYALAVFDGNAGTFQLNLDIVYELAEIIAVTGSVEAFFDFNDSTKWHVWLGQKTPEAKRIGAEILSIIRASMYMMLDNNGFVTGAKAGLEIRESWGPVEIDLAALVVFEAGIFWNPLQLTGYFEMLIELGLKVFGIGIELLLRLMLEAKAAAPFWIHGVAQVALKLPVPLPSFDVSVEFTWEEPAIPAPATPLLTGAAIVHHRSATAWTPVTRRDDPAMPIVPVDAAPLLSFGRPLAGRSVVLRPDGSFEFAGGDVVDDHTFRYAVDRVVVTGDPGGDDEHEVARYPVSDDLRQTPLDFSEASLLPDPTAQEPKWRLWSYDARRGTTTYQREVPDPRAPSCGTDAGAPKRCIDFAGLANGYPFPASFIWKGLTLRSHLAPELVGGTLRVTDLWIELPEPAGEIEILVEGDVQVICYRRGVQVGLATGSNTSPRETFTLRDPELARDPDAATGIDAVWIHGRSALADQGFALVRVCTRSLTVAASEARDAGERERAGEGTDTDTTTMLRPDTLYKLEVDVVTLTSVNGSDPTRSVDEHVFWFRTGRGPGTNDPSASFASSALDNLESYIAATLPAAGGAFTYRGLDLRVTFAETYLTSLYREDEQLAIVVRDGNGRIIGAPSSSMMAWLLVPMLPELWSLLVHRDLGGCAPSDSSPTPVAGVGELWWQPVEPLRAGLAYTAEVTAIRGAETRVLYQLPFTTGAYETPEALVRSGLPTDEDEPELQIVRELAPAAGITTALASPLRAAGRALVAARQALRDALARGERLAIADARAACDTARGTWTATSADGFAAAALALGVDLVGRTLPPVLEVSSIPVGDRQALLVEAPEPLDLDRLSIAVVASGSSTPVHAIGSRDRTRVLLLPDTGATAFAAPEAITFEQLPDTAPELAPRTLGGAPYSFTTRLPL